MCFSATASFTAAAGLLVVGTLTARRARRAVELPFALIPALFAIQQLIEGAIWLTLPDKAPLLNHVLTIAYSLFSHVLWPVYVPIAVLLLEPILWRRRVLTAIALAGGAVGVFLLYFIVSLPIVSQVQGRHIIYVSPHFYIIAVMVLYVASTCMSVLFSSHRKVRLFGVAAFAAFVVAYVFYNVWLISVWCFFAAALSVIVLLYFPRRPANYLKRSRQKSRRPVLRAGDSSRARKPLRGFESQDRPRMPCSHRKPLTATLLTGSPERQWFGRRPIGPIVTPARRCEAPKPTLANCNNRRRVASCKTGRGWPSNGRVAVTVFTNRRRRLWPASLAFLAGIALSIGVSAATPTFPALTGGVVDQANILSPQIRADISNKLEGLETKTSRQLVVVTVPSLQGLEIEDYGYKLGRAWGIGQKKLNNGALFIVAPNERAVRVEVGYGLEPVLTDALSSVILQEEVLPKFRAGDQTGGIVAGTDALIAQLSLPDDQAEAGVAAAAPRPATAANPVPLVLVGLLVLWVVFGLIGTIGGRKGHRADFWQLPLLLFAGGGMGRGMSGRGMGGGGLSGGSFGGGGASGRW